MRSMHKIVIGMESNAWLITKITLLNFNKSSNKGPFSFTKYPLAYCKLTPLELTKSIKINLDSGNGKWELSKLWTDEEYTLKIKWNLLFTASETMLFPVFSTAAELA